MNNSSVVGLAAQSAWVGALLGLAALTMASANPDRRYYRRELVGTAISYGLQRAALTVGLVDEGDVAFRASRGNFGLVWVQTKGLGAPHYQRWTRLSADEWPGLAAELGEQTGIAIGHERNGGLQ